jgi:membrane-associated phospholipid phosphatase
MKKILLILLCLLSFEAKAQIIDTIKKDITTAPDTVKRLHSKVWALVPPAVLITYGASSFIIHPVRRFDYYIHSETQISDADFHTRAESYFQFAPIMMVYGLNLAGVEGKDRLLDRTLLLGLSGGILELTDLSLKHSTHRLRPNGSDYYSFPSGHTSTAFMGAEFLAQEYSDKSVWYGIAGYAIAATTGVFRLYNRDHWFSDVVAGAGIGILSTKAAYLIYPLIRNKLTHTNKQGKSTAIMPIYQDGAAGLSFVKEL